jgi:hypothetical protein
MREEGGEERRGSREEEGEERTERTKERREIEDRGVGGFIVSQPVLTHQTRL